MDDSSAKVLSKKSKIEKLLEDLNNEILACVDFLLHLKNHSSEIVRDLNSLTKPSVYFEEFVNVNSIILKYLSFLNEVNCKFEMLEIPEKKHNHLASENVTINSDIMTTIEELLNLKLSSCTSLANSKNEERCREQVSNLETKESTNCLKEISDENAIAPQQGVSTSEEEEDDIKPVELSREVGIEYEVVIENIQSPSEFYVHVKDKQLDLFIQLREKLKLIDPLKRSIWNKKTGSKKDWLSKELGLYVLYYSKCDEIWCRAKIINWCLNYKDDFLKIFLLDYGEYKCVSVDDIESMPEHIKKYPAFTRRCHLYGILPVDASPSAEILSWGKDSIETMQSLTETAKKLKIKVAPDDDFHPASSLPVTIWLVDQDNKCLNELLVEQKCAVYGSHFDATVIKTETKINNSSEKEIIKNWNPMKEDFESYENSYDFDINDPASYIYGYVGKDYDTTCMHFANTGYCFKGASCRLQHKKLDHLGYTRDQEEVYKNAFNTLTIPPLKSIVEVVTTCILNVNHFCCVLADQNLFSEEENLRSLSSYMNNEKNIKEMKKLLIPPSAGQIVIAEYSADKYWYRGKILESQPESDNFTVLFVDYGNKETVSLSQIRAIEARYLHLPFQALQCFIYGIEGNSKVSVKEAMNYLSKRIIDSKIQIEIVSKLPGEDAILLVNVFDGKGKNIGEDMLACKFAVRKEEMVISSDSEVVPG